MNTQEQTREVLKDMIAKNGSRIFSVTFVKKDGTLRQMTCQTAITSDLVGEGASDSALRGVASRKANNPNLLNVVDTVATKLTGKVARRSINLDTVTRIAMLGMTFDVQAAA